MIKPIGPYWWVRFGAWAIGLASAAALLLVSRRMRAGVRALLLILFALGSYAWAVDPIVGVMNVLTFEVAGGSELFVSAGWSAVRGLMGVIPATVAAAAVLDGIARRGRLGPTAWLGLLLSGLSFAACTLPELTVVEGRWA